MTSAPSATETLASASLQLHKLKIRNQRQNCPRRSVYTIVPSKIARIMVSHLFIYPSNKLQLFRLYQFSAHLGMVNHFEVAPKLGVLIFEGIVTVRTNRYDLLYVVLLERLEIALNLRLKEYF